MISRLRLVVEGSNARTVRRATQETLGAVGLSLSGSSTERARHRVVAAVRRSLVGERLHVSLRFSPPIHVSSCREIVEELAERVQIHAVSLHEERARLPGKPG